MAGGLDLESGVANEIYGVPSDCAGLDYESESDFTSEAGNSACSGDAYDEETEAQVDEWMQQGMLIDAEKIGFTEEFGEPYADEYAIISALARLHRQVHRRRHLPLASAWAAWVSFMPCGS